jgi:thiol-disulfide isomerase/thioredoxin
MMLFWTSWCASCDKPVEAFINFANEHHDKYDFIMCATTSEDGSRGTPVNQIAQEITAKRWRADGIIRHVSSGLMEPVSVPPLSRRGSITSLNSVRDEDDGVSTISQLYGIRGVPSLIIIHPHGYIAWRGRYCAFINDEYEQMLQHAICDVIKEPCPIQNCDMCKGDTSLDSRGVGANATQVGGGQSVSRVFQGPPPRRQNAGWTDSDNFITEDLLRQLERNSPLPPSGRPQRDRSVPDRPKTAKSLIRSRAASFSSGQGTPLKANYDLRSPSASSAATMRMSIGEKAKR